MSAADPPATVPLVVAAGGGFLGWLGATAVDWVHLFPGLTAIALGAAAVLLDSDAAETPATAARSRRAGVGLALPIAVGVLAALTAFGIARLALADRYTNDARGEVIRDPLAALSDTSGALSLNGDAVDTYYVRAAAYARLGRYERSRAALLEALRRDPDNFVTWTLLGDLAFRRGDRRAAKASYTRAAQLNPTTPSYSASSGSHALAEAGAGWSRSRARRADLRRQAEPLSTPSNCQDLVSVSRPRFPGVRVSTRRHAYAADVPDSASRPARRRGGPHPGAPRRRSRLALASLAPQVDDVGEIVVVEDGGDATRPLAERHGARWVGLDRARGPNAARNAGIAATAAEIVVLTEDDVEAPPGWLDALLGAAAAHPETGVFGGPIRGRIDGRAWRTCGREWPPISSFWRGPADREVDLVFAGNMALRRSALERRRAFRGVARALRRRRAGASGSPRRARARPPPPASSATRRSGRTATERAADGSATSPLRASTTCAPGTRRGPAR